MTVYLDSQEVMKFGYMGGNQKLAVGEDTLEVESKLTDMGTNETTIRVNGQVVALHKWV